MNTPQYSDTEEQFFWRMLEILDTTAEAVNDLILFFDHRPWMIDLSNLPKDTNIRNRSTVESKFRIRKIFDNKAQGCYSTDIYVIAFNPQKETLFCVFEEDVDFEESPNIFAHIPLKKILLDYKRNPLNYSFKIVNKIFTKTWVIKDQ